MMIRNRAITIPPLPYEFESHSRFIVAMFIYAGGLTNMFYEFLTFGLDKNVIN